MHASRPSGLENRLFPLRAPSFFSFLLVLFETKGSAPHRAGQATGTCTTLPKLKMPHAKRMCDFV